MPTDAVIYVPTGSSAARWRDACAEYCQQRRYRIVAIVSIWEDVLSLLITGEAVVAVAGRRDHLPAQRRMRLEVITDLNPQPIPEQRRPARRSAAR